MKINFKWRSETQAHIYISLPFLRRLSLKASVLKYIYVRLNNERAQKYVDNNTFMRYYLEGKYYKMILMEFFPIPVSLIEKFRLASDSS